MKLFLSLLLFLGSVPATAQKADTVRKYINEKLQLVSRSEMVFAALGVKTANGWFLQAMYPDTTVLLKAYFKDKNFSLKDGSYQLFHRKNVKAMEGRFVNNIPQGVWRYWYANGQLKDSGLLVNNVMCGKWKSWNEKGQLLIESEYSNEPGQLNNQLKLPKKKPYTIVPDFSPFTGKLDGLTITYHPNGQKKDSGAYVNNSRNGEWKNWHSNGVLDGIGHFRMNELEGSWTFFRENGQKSTEETYANGKLVSMKCYDEQGNLSGTYCSILKPPVPLGDFDNFDEYVLDNVFWPKNLNNDVQGKVKVSYTVTREGEIRNFKIVESPHELLSEEAARFFSTLEKWSPAISHNRAIDFDMQYEIPFLR
jgi:antitoxin component YwqK of YwqJK toxin-antitoxin module